MDNLEIVLVYINIHLPHHFLHIDSNRFINGHKYKAIEFTSMTTTILDKDNVPIEFSNNDLHLYFKRVEYFRNEQLEKLGI